VIARDRKTNRDHGGREKIFENKAKEGTIDACLASTRTRQTQAGSKKVGPHLAQPAYESFAAIAVLKLFHN
jgi:hypothetical protein